MQQYYGFRAIGRDRRMPSASRARVALPPKTLFALAMCLRWGGNFVFGIQSAGFIAIFILWLAITTTGRLIVGPYFLYYWLLRGRRLIWRFRGCYGSYCADRRARPLAHLVGLYCCCFAVMGAPVRRRRGRAKDYVYLLARLQRKKLYCGCICNMALLYTCTQHGLSQHVPDAIA